MIISKEKSERINNRIIELLQQDGRRTYDSIASEVGISVQNVKRRMDILLNQHKISIYGAVKIDQNKSDIFVVSALSVEQSNIRAALQALSSNKSVSAVVRTIGRYDLVCVALLKSYAEFIEYVESLQSLVDGIKSVDTLVSLRIHKGSYRRVNPYLIDSEDRDLIALLMKDGRQSNHELATQIGLTPMTVGRRIKNLLDNRTIKIRTTENLDQNHHFAVFFARIDPAKIDEVISLISNQPEVQFLVTSAGRYDIFGTITFTSEPQLTAFMEQQLSRTKGILSYDTLLILESVWFYNSWFEKYWPETHPGNT